MIISLETGLIDDWTMIDNIGWWRIIAFEPTPHEAREVHEFDGNGRKVCTVCDREIGQGQYYAEVPVDQHMNEVDPDDAQPHDVAIRCSECDTGLLHYPTLPKELRDLMEANYPERYESAFPGGGRASLHGGLYIFYKLRGETVINTAIALGIRVFVTNDDGKTIKKY